jgi:hypothetical protein
MCSKSGFFFILFTDNTMLFWGRIPGDTSLYFNWSESRTCHTRSSHYYEWYKVFQYYTQGISVLHTRYFSITHKVFQYYTQCISVLHTVFQNNTLYMNIWFNVCNLFVLVIITAVILIIWLVECWLLEVQQQIFYLGGLLLHVFQPQKNLFHYYL